MSDYYALRTIAGRSLASRCPQRTRNQQNCAQFTGLLALCAALGAVGCDESEPGEGSATNVKAQGALVSVDQGETTVGFARGTTRVSERTGAFKLSKSPITKKQYKKCQRSGMCKAPKVEECSDLQLAKASFEGADDGAAVCVGRENAEAYCKWVGGRLPTLAEWLRAARGAGVREYPWGSTRASCAQHPKSVEANPRFQQTATESVSTEGCGATAEEALITGKHPAGAASESGMQDVLITPAELLAGHDKSPFATCGSNQHCLVYGLNPGSIDSVKPYAVGGTYVAKPGDEPQLRLFPQAYGFRCLIEK